MGKRACCCNWEECIIKKAIITELAAQIGTESCWDTDRSDKTKFTTDQPGIKRHGKLLQ